MLSMTIMWVLKKYGNGYGAVVFRTCSSTLASVKLANAHEFNTFRYYVFFFVNLLAYKKYSLIKTDWNGKTLNKL